MVDFEALPQNSDYACGDFDMSDEWLLSEITALLGTLDEGLISGFSVDSRLVKRGDLFFALKGEKFDGHQFLREVEQKGAKAAVVASSYRGPSYGLKLIVVPDALTALQMLAREVHKKRRSRVIGVTGSVGKTTVKEFIATILEGYVSVSKTPGNANSQIGFPLSLLNFHQECDVLVAEMGMNHEQEITKLVQIAPPEIGVVTKIGQAHIGNFKDGLAGVARAKAEIFVHPSTKLGVINAQALDFAPFQGLQIPFVTFSMDRSADFTLTKTGMFEEYGQIVYQGILPFSEGPLLENLLAAAVIARQLGMTWEEIGQRIMKLKLLGLRFEKIERDGILFINDSYNASPDAMRAALQNLPQPKMGGKRIAVIGDMPDLGIYSESIHQAMAHFAASQIDHALCYGKASAAMMPIFTQLGKPAEFFNQKKSLKEVLFQIAKPGDVVLIKGANILKLWQLLE